MEKMDNLFVYDISYAIYNVFIRFGIRY